MNDNLITDLNQAIKGNPNSTWQRKFMAFTGDFKMNSEDLGRLFDDTRSLYGIVIIKKNHNQTQYHTERNTFFLKKGEPDYHEFKKFGEAVEFLRKNDSYFKSDR